MVSHLACASPSVSSSKACGSTRTLTFLDASHSLSCAACKSAAEKEDNEEPPATALTSTQSSHVITDEFILWVDRVDRESQIEVLAEIVIAKIVPVTNAHANNGGR